MTVAAGACRGILHSNEEGPGTGESAQKPRHTTDTFYNPTSVKLKIWQNQCDKIRAAVTLLGCPGREGGLQCPGPPAGGLHGRENYLVNTSRCDLRTSVDFPCGPQLREARVQLEAEASRVPRALTL